MHIIKQLNAKLVDESRDLLCGADLVVCDGNLSAQTIERLAQVCDRPLYLDPVSTAWARELKPFIGCFDTVKPNRMELEVLSGCPVDTKENIVLACDILRGKGVRRVFVSLGRDGMYYRGPVSSTRPVRAMPPTRFSPSAWARAWSPSRQATPSAGRCLPLRLKLW